MLTQEQILENKIRYLELLSKLNFDIQEITNYLDKLDFFNQPYTTQYDGAYAGGLCEHSLKFATELNKLSKAYFGDRYTAEDVLKVALFKDFYKGAMYEPFSKRVLNSLTNEWETVTAYKTKECDNRPTFGDLGLSSYMLASKFVTFTDEQAIAIIHSRSTDYVPDYYDLIKSYPLLTLTKMAEFATSCFTKN